MANPAAMAIGGGVASLLGSITQGIGQQFSGEAQANALTYQAGVAKVNEQIEAQNANYERAAGEVSAQESGMKTRFQIGQITAAQGASNLDVNFGSNANVRASQEAIGEQDQAVIRADAARKAFGASIQGFEDSTQASLDLMGASNARTAGTIGAIGSILGGAGSVASKWTQAGQVFPGGGGATSSIFSSS